MCPTARWQYGDKVRVIRNLRNDGTYPGAGVGELLVRRGSIGHVVDIGSFLQDQIIYSVHFLDCDKVVGCRQEELIDAEAPWLASRFMARESVRAAKTLVISGEEVAPIGARGEVVKVSRDGQTILYHVHFDCRPGRIFAVPEHALTADDSENNRMSR